MRPAPRNSFFAVLLAGAALVPSAWAQPAGEAARREMREAERAQAAGLAAERAASARAEQAAQTEARLAAERVAAATKLRTVESATAATAQRIETLTAQRAAAEQRLQTHATDLAELLPLIQRLALHPAETLLAVQADQNAALRGVLVLRGLAGQLEYEAAALRREQAALDTARQAITAEQPRLAAALAAQAAASAGLDRQIEAAQATRRAARDQAADAARQAAEQAARAETLRAAIAELEAQRSAAETAAREEAARAARERRPAEAAAARRRQEALARPSGAGTIEAAARPRGQLVIPVAGALIRGWGQTTEAGPATGVTYRPAPRAHVVAPCAGRVMFAAPFRSFGLLLIVDCGGLYHAVLAGMERLDVQVGRTLKAGEPVGIMPDWDPHVSAVRPSLYLELRQDGRPVDPTPWLGALG